eukprot:TRINITY_DN72001_c0_g1_i1.p1 TRINITY_DN72001_c0_g1~~TRINITY_DN72001_c0_g1_i1.p1  ORF type:complete len:380 (-),score=74.81 TRINITY_DN72001_c0_g1_i1:106-1245(-)
MADNEDDTDPGLAGLSPEFQAMVGGLAGHTASFARTLERRVAASTRERETEKDDEVFLESYADLEIHQVMLRDQPRVDAYRRAIESCGEAWRASGGTTVVDVGSGTGLLAILAARAGASRVVAVEASRMAHFLPKIVAANVPAGVVEVKECRAEELELEPDAKVDVIVSEWMGYFLLFENMLPSVLAVRDRYLKKGGQMLPSKCRLKLAPLEDKSWRPSKVDFWNDVHGIDMSALVPLAVATECGKGQHRFIDGQELMGSAFDVFEFDCHEVTEGDLARFEAPISVEVPAGRRLDGFASWFECEFGAAGWLLSTGPDAPQTHWRQTAFNLRKPIEGGGGIVVTGTVTVSKHEEFSRGYRVTFDLKPPGRRSRTETFELR